MPHKTALFGTGGPAPRGVVIRQADGPGRGWRRWPCGRTGCATYRADGVPLGSLEGLGANLAGLERWGYVVVRPDSSAGADGPSGGCWQRGAHQRRLGGQADAGRPVRAGGVGQARGARSSAGGNSGSALTWSLSCGLRWSRRSATPARWRPEIGRCRCTCRSSDTPTGCGPRSRDRRMSSSPPPVPGLVSWRVTRRGLGLSALLARALLLVTLVYERRSRLSLPVSADILPAIGTQGAPMRVLPLRSGVSREAVSAATKFLQRHGYATIGPDPAAGRGQAVALTERGVAELEAHERRIGAIEEGWAERRGVAEIGRLRECVLAFAERRADGSAGPARTEPGPRALSGRLANPAAVQGTNRCVRRRPVDGTAAASDGPAPWRLPRRFLISASVGA